MTGRNGLGRARLVVNRAGTALTGAVRTGLDRELPTESFSPGAGGRRPQIGWDASSLDKQDRKAGPGEQTGTGTYRAV